MREELEASAEFIRERSEGVKSLSLFMSPEITELLDEEKMEASVPYSQVPHFPQKEGMYFRVMDGVPIFDFQYHAEGSTMDEIAYPVRTNKFLGVENILLVDFISIFRNDVDLFLVNDHINLMGTNPLIGKTDSQLGPSFPDMTNTYSESINNFLKDILLDLGAEFKEGVLCGINSKYQLTDAQKRYYQLIGANAASYSIIPEVIAAHHVSLNVAAIGVNFQRKSTPVLENLQKLICEIILEEK